MRRTLSVLAVAAALAACTAAGAATPLTLTLDWTPNADHAAIYVAKAKGLFAKAGLDVTVQTPSDPTATLQLVAAGRSDLALTYEQELFLARGRVPVVAVAALVPVPLNSVISIDPKVRTIADLKGRSIGITGVPADEATLSTILAKAGLRPSDVTVVRVGYDLLPALLSHRVDAVLGVYRNVEGVELERRGLHPAVFPVDRVGVPRYDELVVVAGSKRLASDPSYAAAVRAAVAALAAGTRAARSDAAATVAALAAPTQAKPDFLTRSVAATLPLLAGPKGPMCLTVADWQRFGDWMYARKLVPSRPDARSVVTTAYLPASCR